MPTPTQPKNNNEENTTSRPTPTVTKKLEYSPWETQYHRDVLLNVRNAFNAREQARKEFDSMSYSQKTDKEREVDLAYVKPAKSKYDIRVNTGTSREKTTTIMTLAMSYDFETKVQAFDKNDVMLDEFSEACSDLIYKANKMQEWQHNRQTTYRGMCSHGTFFTMEAQEFPTKMYKGNIPLSTFGKLDVDWSISGRKRDPVFRTISLDPRMVILGNIFEEDLRKQPFIAVARVVSEAEARNLFATFDRWNSVPLRTGQVSFTDDSDVFSAYTSEYMLSDSLQEGEVEIVYFMRSLDYGNELAIYCNGVAMLPIKNLGKTENGYKTSGYPLTVWSRSGEYPIVDWQFERTPNFFYSKGSTTKTRFDQEMTDFFWKYMTQKALLAVKPPLSNMTGMTVTEKMLQPGVITADVPADKLMSFLPKELVQGIGSGDFSALNMMKELMGEKTVTSSFQGSLQQQYATAQQFSESQKAQLRQLGALVDGIIRGEKRRADLLLRNSILPYWVSKQDYDGEMRKSKSEAIAEGVADVYRTFTVDRGDSEGKYRSVVKVGEVKGADGFDIMEQEDKEEKTSGIKNRYKYIDPEKLDFMRTLFYYETVPNERDNDVATRTIADSETAMLMNLFPNDIDKQKLKERWAKSRKKPFSEFFLDQTSPDLSALTGGISGSVQQNMQSGGSPNGGFNASSMVPPSSMALQS